jgi:hypothetical protein
MGRVRVEWRNHVSASAAHFSKFPVSPYAIGQPKAEYNHRNKRGLGNMLLDWNPRNAGQIRTHAVLVVAGLFALLVARVLPPDFAKVEAPLSSINALSTISAVSSHDQRPRFDCNGPHWNVPIREFLPFPPMAKARHLTSALEIFPALSVKGHHYNRPPPLG